MDDLEIERYSRQLLLKNIGGGGQERLLASSVFVLGAGGLGSPAAIYLAAAGVGRLILADSDRVELSNLQRQILFSTHSLGQFKGEAAQETLQRLNPKLQVTLFNERVDERLLDHILPQCHLVLDASDNFPTRYLLNTYCLIHKKRLISGAVLGFEGQLATFHHGVNPLAPCYRCLYPLPPERGGATCASAGVLGAAAGVVGCLQATEAIKELLNIGQSLAGYLLLINPLDHLYHRVAIPKNPHCTTCSHT